MNSADEDKTLHNMNMCDDNENDDCVAVHSVTPLNLNCI